MHALLIIVASLTTASSPTPTLLVLDGCNTASAIRAAEIRLLAPEDARVGPLLDELLRQPDGAVCLLESDVLVALHHVHQHADLVARALTAGLFSRLPHVAQRAGAVLGHIAGVDPERLDGLLRRIGESRGGTYELGRRAANRSE